MTNHCTLCNNKQLPLQLQLLQLAADTASACSLSNDGEKSSKTFKSFSLAYKNLLFTLA
jgi:hypothetical protein